jgi:hypothetical protein
MCSVEWIRNVGIDALRICSKHNDNNNCCWHLVRPKPQENSERDNFKGHENKLKYKEVDSHCKSDCGIDKMVSKANLETKG